MPQDFGGDLNVVIIAYEQQQQAQVDTWVPTITTLMEEIPGLEFYELPVVGEIDLLRRKALDHWMRGGIRTPTREAGR